MTNEIEITRNPDFEESKQVLDIKFLNTGKIYLSTLVPDALGKNLGYVNYLWDDAGFEELRCIDNIMLLVRDKNDFENLELSYEEIHQAALAVATDGEKRAL